MGRAKTVSPNLPPRMICRVQRSGKAFYYYVTKHPERKEIPLGSALDHALAEYKRLSAGHSFTTSVMLARHEVQLLARIRKNAKARNIEMFLVEKDIAELFVRANGKCELTGLPFDFKKIPGLRIRPWIPSVDRIDSTKPYRIDNCRLICACVNSALNQFGEGLLIEIANGILRTQTGKRIPSLRSAPHVALKLSNAEAEVL